MSHPKPPTATKSDCATEPTAPTVGLGALRGESRQILERHLDRILSQLARPNGRIDIALVRAMLLALSADIRSRADVFHGSDYHWVLRQLTAIYARGLRRRTQDPYTTTAAAYAQVIETITHACPGQDYCEAVGQLVGYMVLLFQTRENSWRLVFEHILSIPDAVEAKQLLDRAFLVEIREWAEAGVENLFSIRADLYEKIGGLQVRIEGIEGQIRMLERELGARRRRAAVRSNVIDLERVRTERLRASLLHARRVLEEEKRTEESIVALIESDIREFEDKLRKTARAYYLRSV